jgi:hypothetical protein
LTPLRSSSASSEKAQVLNLREAAPAAQERFEFMSTCEDSIEKFVQALTPE